MSTNNNNSSFIFGSMKRSVMKEKEKWFLEFPSEMIECESVVIVNMCEAGEVYKCKDANI